jgi:hypothetical protein
MLVVGAAALTATNEGENKGVVLGVATLWDLDDPLFSAPPPPPSSVPPNTPIGGRISRNFFFSSLTHCRHSRLMFM